MPRTHLLLIDPQNDFCDLPRAAWPYDARSGATTAPALPVAGAHADMQRLATLLRDSGDAFAAITVTLDTHHRLDVAHPTFWRRGPTHGGTAVAPFTTITARQVRAGEFVPRTAEALPRVLAYLDALEAAGRYTLMVWPVHCEIGTWGHAIHCDVSAAIGDWEAQRQRVAGIVRKGENPWTEHYSAVCAEVPDPGDPSTGLNQALLARLDAADAIVIAGEASSHCVRATTEHIVAHLPSGRPERLTLLTDCMSPVAGFAAEHAAFLDAMRAVGARLCSSAELADELHAGLPA